MALPKDYAGQRCSLSRALEVVGERWTLLIVRDAFFGVRCFGDFAAHLRVPRAVLTARLETLREAGVLAETRGSHGHSEYVLTDKGLSLWPVVRDLLRWGDEYCSPNGPRRVFQHVQDAGIIAPDGACATCGSAVPPSDLTGVVRQNSIRPMAANRDPGPVARRRSSNRQRRGADVSANLPRPSSR